MEDDATKPDSSGIEEVAEAIKLPAPPTAEQSDAAESLIRQANLAKIRGLLDQYEKTIHEAVELAPGSTFVQEALGDLYLSQRRVRNAKDAFHLAFQLDSTNASAERKYGEAVLAVQLALDPNFLSQPADDSLASGRAMLLMSFLVPGLGQIVQGDTRKGYGLLAAWSLGIFFAVIDRRNLQGLMSLIGKRGPEFNPVILIPLGVSLIAWIWAVSDASSRSKAIEVKKIMHPVPPVDKKIDL